MRTDTLVRRAQRGEGGSREALARAWLPPVYAVALAITRRAADAEDVTQEAFVRAFRALPSLRRAGRFGPWIVQITRNAAHDLHRRKRPDDLGAGTELLAARQETVFPDDDVVRAWRQLPEDERLVCWLKVVDGMTIRQVADLLATSKSRVDRSLRRALESMRRELSRC